MKTIIRKLYWDYEKEEKWLNEMSAKGFALTDYSWCRYVFADCEPGEYIYRIELLEYLPSHPVSQKYLRFLEESGVEHVSSYIRWVYFRKKASDGIFDIYSDIDSKIKHYQRINLLWLIIGCANTVNGLVNLSYAFIPGNLMYPLHITLGIITACIGIALIALGYPARKKIRKLKKEKMVVE